MIFKKSIKCNTYYIIYILRIEIICTYLFNNTMFYIIEEYYIFTLSKIYKLFRVKCSNNVCMHLQQFTQVVYLKLNPFSSAQKSVGCRYL